MKKVVTAQVLNRDKGNENFELELPVKCPICEVAYAEGPKASYYSYNKYEDSQINKVYAIYFCPHCEQLFLVVYFVVNSIYEYKMVGHIERTYPMPEFVTEFSGHIKSLSPQFVEIYNQSERAENAGLHEICGMGYRKALEFLIKDFVIMQNPENSDQIKKMQLAQCIRSYINDENIKTLAERSAWIGNDETHYVRVHEERDVHDLKKFIEAIAYFISMVLVVEDATSILPKKKN